MTRAVSFEMPEFAHREHPGSTRYSIPVEAVSSADRDPSDMSRRGKGGGDEETRTPDPLLAKEMLFRLSYVPSARGRGPDGTWWAFLDSNQRPLPYQGSALTN